MSPPDHDRVAREATRRTGPVARQASSLARRGPPRRPDPAPDGARRSGPEAQPRTASGRDCVEARRILRPIRSCGTLRRRLRGRRRRSPVRRDGGPHRPAAPRPGGRARSRRKQSGRRAGRLGRPLERSLTRGIAGSRRRSAAARCGDRQPYRREIGAPRKTARSADGEPWHRRSPAPPCRPLDRPAADLRPAAACRRRAAPRSTQSARCELARGRGPDLITAAVRPRHEGEVPRQGRSGAGSASGRRPAPQPARSRCSGKGPVCLPGRERRRRRSAPRPSHLGSCIARARSTPATVTRRASLVDRSRTEACPIATRR